MKIFIAAFDSDNHTAPLKWALEQAGYSVVCWPGLSWAEPRQATLSFNGATRMVLGRYSLDPGDVVWIRRPNPPVLNPNVNPADKAFAETEYRWFSHSVLYLLEHLPVRVINPYSASRVINNKSVQLFLAAKNGLHVPATVMSNAPRDVRNAFTHSSQRMVCKPFFPHIWKKDASEARAVTETFEIKADELPEDEVLTFAPAIYQQMVVKAFDVRMVLLGTTVYSFSLHTPGGVLDWRQEVGQGHASVEPIDSPADVQKAVLAFARDARIEFGSLDFAVDENGRWWFLEINEEGQFLWLDDFCPNAIQQKFLAFLTLPKGSTREQIEAKQTQFPSWKDYCQSPAKDHVPEEFGLATPILSTEP